MPLVARFSFSTFISTFISTFSLMWHIILRRMILLLLFLLLTYVALFAADQLYPFASLSYGEHTGANEKLWVPLLAALIFFSILLYGGYALLNFTKITSLRVRRFYKQSMFAMLIILGSLQFRACLGERIRISGSSMEPTLKEDSIVWMEKVTTGISLPRLRFPFGPLLPYKLFDKGLFSLKRGAIIAFIWPEARTNKETVYIKRIIGLGGEYYAFYKGSIYISKTQALLTPHLSKMPNLLASTMLAETYLPHGMERTTPLRPLIESPALKLIPPAVSALGEKAAWAAQFGISAQGRVPQGSVLVLGDARLHSHDSRSYGFIPLSHIIGRVIK